jgi:NifB/MoaA-like Fe-S oxidoreductase
LISGYSNIQSVGIVPVGITRFNKNEELSGVDKETADKAISLLGKLKDSYGKNISERVFLSDEFYLISGTEIPSFESYKSFLQINNGIGKSADFLNDIKIFLKKNKKGRQTGRLDKKILIITSEYGSIIIRKAIKKLYSLSANNTVRYDNVFFELITVRNTFFGGNVKVTGLLTGSDLLYNIDRKVTNDYEYTLIPDSIFNNDGLTLDGLSRGDISSMRKNINIVPENGTGFITSIDRLAGV